MTSKIDQLVLDSVSPSAFATGYLNYLKAAMDAIPAAAISCANASTTRGFNLAMGHPRRQPDFEQAD